MRVKYISTLAALAIAAAALSMQSPVDAAPLPLLRVPCESVLGDDPGEPRAFRLDNNLLCSSVVSPAITLAAPGMTIDLNGHRISGVGSQTAIVANEPNATIRNGIVDNFVTGIQVNGTSPRVTKITSFRNRTGIRVEGKNGIIAGNILVKNEDFGIELLHPTGKTTVSGNTVTGTGSNGIRLSDAPKGTIIRSNRVFGNERGISLSDESTGVLVERNTSQLNTLSGIELSSDADDNRIVGNRTIGNAGTGIGVSDSASGNSISGNTSTANFGDGIVVTAENNSVTGNTASKNHSDGIEVAGAGSTGNVIVGNRTHENAETGIKTAVAATIRRNAANFNGYPNGINGDTGLGIDAHASSTGAGNTARGNDDEAQCSGGASCITGPVTPPPLRDCDDSIDADTVLRNPLSCAAFGSFFNATGISYNLNGHRVEGNGTGSMTSFGGPGAVTLRNGVISDWAVAFDVTNADGVVARDLLISDVTDGIAFDNSIRGKALKNTIVGATESAIRYAHTDVAPSPPLLGTASSNLVGASVIGENYGILGTGVGLLDDAFRVSVTGNTVYGADRGIAVDESALITMRRNTLIANGTGINLFATGQNVIGTSRQGNRIFASVGNGVALESSDINAIGFNLLSGNGTGIGVVGSDLVSIRSNTIRHSHADGVHLDTDSESALLVRNKVITNGGNGIIGDNGASPIDVTRNTASHNGHLGAIDDNAGLGIDVVATADGGNNVAKGNDNTAECDPADLC